MGPLQDFSKGQPAAASHFQQGVDALRELYGKRAATENGCAGVNSLPGLVVHISETAQVGGKYTGWIVDFGSHGAFTNADPIGFVEAGGNEGAGQRCIIINLSEIGFEESEDTHVLAGFQTPYMIGLMVGYDEEGLPVVMVDEPRGATQFQTELDDTSGTWSRVEFGTAVNVTVYRTECEDDELVRYERVMKYDAMGHLYEVTDWT